MNLLILDTATDSCGIALVRDGRLLAESVTAGSRTHSTRLLNGVEAQLRDAAMTLNDLDGFAVSLGPGSFTGVRIAVATVKGLALVSGKPVVGFSSLAMLAMNLPWAAHPVCPMFDARKKEVYTALYRCTDQPQPLMADCVTAPDSFLERLSGPTIFLGAGAEVYRDLIRQRLGPHAHFAPEICSLSRASAGALLASAAFARGETVAAADLQPVYIRPSEAELARQRQLSAVAD